jgi:uncharacterized protein
MRLGGRRESSNIEDRRRDGGGFRGGRGFGRGRVPIGFPTGGGARGSGIGIFGILIILVILWLLGINPLKLLSGKGLDSPAVIGDGTINSTPSDSLDAPSDEGGRFVARILADTEDTWTSVFQNAGHTYRKPTLVLFTGQAASACGFASAASGPFYCPNDQKLYIDLTFYDELTNKFGAPGDFAEAYVIAHEVGHHVQNLLGILPKVDVARQNSNQTEANALSVRLELQADCLAGVWGREADRRGILDPGDIEEGLAAAASIGDDTLQKRSQGYVVPESFTHGTSAQRVRWFRIGFQQGQIDACDTFGVSQF